MLTKTSTKNNIFKQDIIDSECCLLNKWKGTFGTTFYEKAGNNHFVKYYKNTYQHGGISLEEMIIPCAIFAPNKKFFHVICHIERSRNVLTI